MAVKDDRGYNPGGLMGVGGITNNDAGNGYLGGIISNPKITESLEPQGRSIRSIEMARDVIRTVIMAGRNRSIVNSRILAKINAERPYDAYKLEAEGLGWRSNFTTKPLPTMAEKVAPRFYTVVDNLKYFTSASLSDKWQNNVEKTETFRKEITDTIRQRKGWRTFLESLSFNNAVFGHTIIAWLDRWSWFPRMFEQDYSFAADGTKSDPTYAQILVLKEECLPHELFAQVKAAGGSASDAEDAGFTVANVREAIETATPMQIRDRLNVGGTLESWWQHALRELTIGASYQAGNSVIVIYNLYVREVSGKVSHYRLAGPGLLLIQQVEDEFESMNDAVAFFSFQRGNGTLHGSKGIGRDLYELAGMQDRIRNEVVDRLVMSGKLVVQGDIRRIHTYRMHVVGNTMVIPAGWSVIEQKLDGNVDPFIKLDAYISQLVDQLIGSVSTPNQVQGEAFRSPAAWNLLAARQQEGQDVRIVRFMEQFAAMIQGFQRRLCDPETIDEEAKAMQKRLLEKMTREELDELAASSTAGTVNDLTPTQRQLIVAFAQEKKGNPLYNQRQLELEDCTARVDADFADRVLLPDNDPTVLAEQTRMQNLEMVLLSHGQAVEVSPRDNHLIHLQVIMPQAEQMGAQMMSGQFGIPELEAVLAHVNEHYQQALLQGTKKEALAEVAEFVKKIGPALQKLQEIEQQKQQLAAQAQQAGQQPQLPPQGQQPVAPPMQQ